MQTVWGCWSLFGWDFFHLIVVLKSALRENVSFSGLKTTFLPSLQFNVYSKTGCQRRALHKPVVWKLAFVFGIQTNQKI